MPKEGYTAVTISEDVMKQAQAYIDKINKQAGYKKIRNQSHFVEEAVVSFTLNEIRKGAEDPEEILQKVVKIILERDDLLKIMMKQFLEKPHEEASQKLHKILSQKELASLKKLL